MNPSIIKSRFVSMLLAGASVSLTAHAASISEPPTIFYGQVIGTGGAQPFVLTEGDLEWTIMRNDGSELDISTILYAQNAGEISYQINVPAALAGDDFDSIIGIPLPALGNTNEHARVSVNGTPAELIGPSGAYFEVGQKSRAATYRLDLMVDVAPSDTDGDGMPDWWEKKYGLDAGLNDGDWDADGDGIANRDEYEGGFNPNADNRTPELLTQAVLVYLNHTTGIQLKSADVDSGSTNVIYTLLHEPEYGSLALLPAAEVVSETALGVGAQFSQADVDAGRLVFRQETEVAVSATTSFTVALQDEDSAQTQQEISISFYAPATEDVLVGTTLSLRKAAYNSSASHQQVVRDLATSLRDEVLTVPVCEGAEVSGHYFLSGKGDDMLSGGTGNDTFMLRQGAHLLTGGTGSDLFAFTAESAGVNKISDFGVSENDVLDLSRKIAGRTGLMKNLLHLESIGTTGRLSIDDLTVELAACPLTELALYDLVLNGQLKIGDLKLLPRYSVAAMDDQASENGENSAQFVIRREGDLSFAQSVSISMQGVATEGVDFASIGTEILFAAGVNEVTVSVRPFKDADQEGEEVAELVLQADDDYVLGAQARASVFIKDLQSIVGLQVIDAIATLDHAKNGLVLVTREEAMKGSLVVILEISGSAVNGTDYKRISSYLTFAPGDTMKVIEIETLASAVLTDGAECVDIAVRASSLYERADVAEGRITLLSQVDTLNEWQAREFPTNDQDVTVFANERGASRSTNLQRYAYGLGNGEELTPSQLPKLIQRDGHMTVDIHRNPQARDVTLVVEVSDDFQHWSSAESVIRKITVAEHADAVNMETYQVVPLVESVDHMYVRIKIECSL